MKICKKCGGDPKPLTEFRRDKEWLRGTCRECEREYGGGRIYSKQEKIERSDYQILRRKTDIEFGLIDNMRSRIRLAIKRKQKAGSAVNDLGCSIEELKNRFEKKFTKENGWSWTGPGRKLWHIDHIKPLASFDLTDRVQFLEAVNYKNLQPLSKEENGRKGVSILIGEIL